MHEDNKYRLYKGNNEKLRKWYLRCGEKNEREQRVEDYTSLRNILKSITKINIAC